MFVSNKIKDLLNSDYKILDKKTKKYRKIMPKDIVILLRTTKNYSDIFSAEISKLGIPVFSDTNGQYLNSLEISLMISILKVIDNPMQDIPLIATLRSTIGGFTDSELVDIRLVDKNCSFFDAMQKVAGQNEGKLSKKVNSFLNQINKWQSMAQYMPLDLLIWQIYTDTGYYSYVSLMPDGQKRSKNLKMLFERAGQYEKTSLKGLFYFIKFIDKLTLSSSDMSAAKTIGENDDVVRIMSIHKSKGLEFPIVFLSGTGKKFNMQDLNKNLLIHQDIGLGPDYINSKRRIAYPTLPKLAIRQKMKTELLSEELRILYVALTRAKEKLIITGIDKDFSKSKAKYKDSNNNGKVSTYLISKSNSFFTWLEQVAFSRQEDTIDKIIKLNIYNKEQILKQKETEKEDNTNLLRQLEDKIQNCFDENINKQIEKQLNWKYFNIELSKVPTKMSVTELKRFENASSEEQEDSLFKDINLEETPKFLKEQNKITNAQKGSIIHLIIQHIDFKRDYTLEILNQEINNMIQKKLLTNEQVESIDIQKIYKFTKSDLYNRAKKSSKVYKEQPFYITVPVNKIYSNVKSDEKILIQGIIDCYFEEDGEIVLVDYKTDYVENDNLESLIDKYKIQLQYYKMALENATNKKVKQVYIYSLYKNEEILLISLD